MSNDVVKKDDQPAKPREVPLVEKPAEIRKIPLVEKVAKSEVPLAKVTDKVEPPKEIKFEKELEKPKVVLEIPITKAVVTKPVLKAVEKCICEQCPTFILAPLADGYFCVRGFSLVPPPKEGCVCGRCTIFKNKNLQKGRFCES